jgi:hypothetical protein
MTTLDDAALASRPQGNKKPTARQLQLADRSNLIRSLILVAAGGLTAIAIGWLVGLVVVNDVVAATA